MGLSCGAKMGKLLLFIFNIIFFITGAVSLGLGIWLKVDKSSVLKFTNAVMGANKDSVNNFIHTESLIDYTAYILIAVGIFTFITGFCGCCGAIKENPCLLITYSILVGIILFLFILGAILIVVFKNKAEGQVQKGAAILLKKNYIGLPMSLEEENSVSMLWDIVMIHFKCCGVNGSSDFNDITAERWYKEGRWYNNGKNNYTDDQVKIPVACCQFKSTKFQDKNDYSQTTLLANIANTDCPVNKKNVNDVPCYTSVRNFLVSKGTQIAIAAGVLAAIQLFGIIISCCLVSAIKDDGY